MEEGLVLNWKQLLDAFPIQNSDHLRVFDILGQTPLSLIVLLLLHLINNSITNSEVYLI